ncbi:hypothetical protein Emed_007470 [Eimeria media]
MQYPAANLVFVWLFWSLGLHCEFSRATRHGIALEQDAGTLVASTKESLRQEKPFALRSSLSFLVFSTVVLSVTFLLLQCYKVLRSSYGDGTTRRRLAEKSGEKDQDPCKVSCVHRSSCTGPPVTSRASQGFGMNASLRSLWRIETQQRFVTIRGASGL